MNVQKMPECHRAGNTKLTQMLIPLGKQAAPEARDHD